MKLNWKVTEEARVRRGVRQTRLPQSYGYSMHKGSSIRNTGWLQEVCKSLNLSVADAVIFENENERLCPQCGWLMPEHLISRTVNTQWNNCPQCGTKLLKDEDNTLWRP